MLRPDVVVAERLGLAARELHDLLRARREAKRPAGRRLALSHHAPHPGADAVDLNAERRERARGDAVVYSEETEEEMFRADVVVRERLRLVLCERDDVSGPVGKAPEGPAWSLRGLPSHALEETLSPSPRRRLSAVEVDDLVNALMAQREVFGDLAERAALRMEAPNRVVVVGPRPLRLVLELEEAVAAEPRVPEEVGVERRPSSVLDSGRPREWETTQARRALCERARRGKLALAGGSTRRELAMTQTLTETGKLLENHIGGRRVAVEAAEVLDVLDPANGGLLARVPLSGASEVDQAARVAQAAFEEWSEVPVMERARAMFRLQQLYEEHFEELSELVTLENGKAIKEARGEVRRGIDVIEFAAGMPTLMMGGALEQVSRGVDTELFRQPLGVVAAITPFNFPSMVPLWTAPIAVAAGNAYILKPSQRTPLSALRLAELFEEAGVPPGVVNVVHGAADAVNAICDHPLIRAVSFVGSAPVAKHVYVRSASAGKRVQALAGAKNHVVVMPDADLDLAAPGLFSSAFANAGQRCLAGSVGVAVGGIADELVERLVRIAKESPIGPGLDPENTITPVTTEEARRRVADYIELGEQEGARLLVDGRFEGGDGGFFLGPTILDDVRPEMKVAQEEIFGPVLSVERLSSLEEALDVIARNEFGNATAIFTRDGGVARAFRRKVTAGMVGINIPVPASMAFFPFAGWKGSFYGDLHATGKDGVYFFTESKVVTTRWPS